MPLNRNLAAFRGTLSGSPVTLDPTFLASEWQITNRDASVDMSFIVNGQTLTVPAQASVVLEIVAGSAQISGASGNYEVECAEVPGSLALYR